MANFNFNIEQGADFSVTLESLTETDCSSVYVYKVNASSGDSIRMSLGQLYGKNKNTKYTQLGVDTDWDGTEVVITYASDLFFSFSISNSGTAGLFNKVSGVVHNDSISSPDYNRFDFIVQRANDSQDCDSSSSGASDYDSLSDTPDTKIGNEGKLIKVSDDGLKHEYFDQAVLNSYRKGTEYTFSTSVDTLTNVIKLISVNPDDTTISMDLNNANIGSAHFSKGAGWTMAIEVFEYRLYILFADYTTSSVKVMIFQDFRVDETSETFSWANVDIIDLGINYPQYTLVEMIHADDSFYVLFPGEPSKIGRFSINDFSQLSLVTLPDTEDYHNIAKGFVYGSYIFFLAGKNDYSGLTRVSKVDRRTLANESLYFLVDQNSSKQSIPGAGCLFEDGILYVVQGTWANSSFGVVSVDMRNIESPVELASNEYTITGSNTTGLGYGIVLFGDRLLVGVWYGNSGTSTNDNQIVSIYKEGLAKIEQVEVANTSSLFTISSSGRLVWATTTGDAGSQGNTESTIVSYNPVNLSEALVSIYSPSSSEIISGISYSCGIEHKFRSESTISHSSSSGSGQSQSVAQTYYRPITFLVNNGSNLFNGAQRQHQPWNATKPFSENPSYLYHHWMLTNTNGISTDVKVDLMIQFDEQVTVSEFIYACFDNFTKTETIKTAEMYAITDQSYFETADYFTFDITGLTKVFDNTASGTDAEFPQAVDKDPLRIFSNPNLTHELQTPVDCYGFIFKAKTNYAATTRVGIHKLLFR